MADIDYGEVGSNIVYTALHAGAAIADPKKNPEPHGRAYAVVPEGSSLEYLERPAFPLRRAGTVKLSDTASFLEYWKRQGDQPGSYIYGSMVPAQFLAVLNEHYREHPDWRDHRALYALTHSDEWNTWAGKSGKQFDGNDVFAAWLEENLFDIVAPEPAKFMDVALNMRIRQGQVFGKKVRLNDGDIVLEYSNSVEGTSTMATGETLTIPERFEISVPVFKGRDAPKYIVEARFRYRLNNGSLKIHYDLVRPNKTIETAFAALLDEIETTANTKILWGTPE